MNWLYWFLIGWIGLGAVLTVAFVGKPKKPTTPGTAAIILVIDAAIITAIIVGWPR